MINRGVLLLLLLLVACSEPSLPEQGFAGLGSDATGFAQVEPGIEIRYPDALNQHPEYRIEWWYITANLQSETGELLGIQWTLFRMADSPAPQQEGWANQQRWLGHVGLTRANQHLFAQSYARGGVGQAGVVISPFSAWIDNWSVSAVDADATDFTLTASTREFNYTLTLSRVGPEVLHGEQGFSVKSAGGQASYYLSLPFLAVSGSIQIGDEHVSVKGDAWLDREWSSQPLSADQQGWDWFSLHLDQGDKLMLFRLRHAHADDYYAGTYIRADGTTESLKPQQIQMRPIRHHSVANRELPVAWQLTVEDFGIDLRTQALNPNAWMATDIAYWEGPIQFTGSHSGKGYLEMTGY
ncbi:MAG: iron ABC transporter permease [Rheinheimera sp.]|uniref:lipocalin-like domain-containing protein n=1 Tax=Arsukibacterium sp. UBA3155 TaxID=1946058 RepID=UPI000C91B933|nr:lipocalin-like domain-containing protein [Arsukibacterium sp. UBA3155]MAD75105.1 iron ABC transporter permease [Rheinheimera sp.]|tara:strand:+ start:75379 stop:76440 length:1062 start_codon:yes stop_codon:yes gene_type:complete